MQPIPTIVVGARVRTCSAGFHNLGHAVDHRVHDRRHRRGELLTLTLCRIADANVSCRSLA